ncbi:MAG: hypothetical protein JNM76_14785 [Betaproteobacteria bacterium]|nr:hypothetical protein [Betaproteobacteria bacterium]
MLEFHDKLWATPAATKPKVTPVKSKPAGKAKPAAKKKSKPGAPSLKPLFPSPALQKIVGSAPLNRTDVTSKVWAYIKKHKLQDTKNKRMINANADLAAVFGGKSQASMFEMTKLVTAHLASKPWEVPLIRPMTDAPAGKPAKPAAAAKSKTAKKNSPVMTPVITPPIRPIGESIDVAHAQAAHSQSAPAATSRAEEKLAEKREACLADLAAAVAKHGEDITRAQYAALKTKTGRSYETAFGGWTQFIAARKAGAEPTQPNTIAGMDVLKDKVPLKSGEKFLTKFKHEPGQLVPVLDPAHQVEFKEGTTWHAQICAYPIGEGKWISGYRLEWPADPMPLIEQPGPASEVYETAEMAIAWRADDELEQLNQDTDVELSDADQDVLAAYKNWLTKLAKPMRTPLAKLPVIHPLIKPM